MFKKHDISCASEKKNHGRSKQAYKWASDVFHDLNSILYTVSNIHPKAGVSLKVGNVFLSENLALFSVSRIFSIWKSTKNRNSEIRWKTTENTKFKSETEKSSW